MDNIYAGVTPVTAEWIGAHKGEVWTIPFIVTLDDLIEANGYDDMNLLCDERTGVTLYDLAYDVVYDADDEVVGNNRLLINATGQVADDLDID